MLSGQALENLFAHARSLHEQAQLEEAYLIYRKLRCIIPENHALTGLMGTCLTQQGRHEDAMNLLRRAVFLRPEHAASHSNLGNALKDRKDLTEAMGSYRNALILQPAFDEGYNNRAMALLDLKQLMEAFEEIQRAISLTPDSSLFVMNQGNILRNLKRMDEGLEKLDLAIKLNPSYPDAYISRSFLLQEQMEYDRAIQDNRNALIFDPKLDLAYLAHGNCLITLREFHQANTAYQRALTVKDSCPDVISAMLYCAEKQIDWESAKRFLSMAQENILAKRSVGSPLPLLSISDDPGFHKNVADYYVKPFELLALNSCLPKAPQKTGKIRIGYFSSDIREHPVYQNLRPLLVHHNREVFEVFAFDFSPDSCASSDGLFDYVEDIRGLDDASAAALSRSLNIDIAIDLNGHTQFSRPGIFFNRAAPVQINFLGYPGTMGGCVHDYIIADHYVIPQEMDAHYSEKPIRLPIFFMPYDFSEARPEATASISKAQFGLPENQFIFCSFNAFHKVTRDMFDLWAEILRCTPESVLWIALRDGITLSQLRDLFESRGVQASRIIPAERVASEQEHLARLQMADLMLDTYPYNSHTTACDAVAAGLPVLTLCGKSFASRVSFSLLAHLGLDELIETDTVSYKQKAIQLAQNPGILAALREQMMARRSLLIAKDYGRTFESSLLSLVN